MVYRGRRLPDLIGAYIYGDYVNGNIWALRWDEKSVVEKKLLVRTHLPITSFGEDESGELIFSAFDGYIYQLRPVEQTTSEEPFPRKLSQTGLFESVLELKPNAGAIPYSINVPLWSDGADKEHFLALPTMNSVTFSDDGHWQFPVGTVFVKTFHMKTADRRPETRRRLETRLLVHNARGWVGYTYRWNEQQTDAVLLAGVVVTTIETNSHTVANNVSWYFPSRSDCMACHTRSSGFVLGVNTRQMNRTGDIGTARENQLVAMARMNIFREPPSKPPD